MINDILSRATKGEPTPEVGMGATFLSHSDRNPGTIVSVEVLRDGTMRIGVQHDRSKVVAGSGHDGSAEYEFEPNPEGSIVFFQRKPAEPRWRAVYQKTETGRWCLGSSYTKVRIGERDEYRDPSF